LLVRSLYGATAEPACGTIFGETQPMTRPDGASLTGNQASSRLTILVLSQVRA